jgi:DNA-binding CsgD family transcriptional regulator
VVPFDASGWCTTDPDTALFTGVVALGGLPPPAAMPFFENEIVDPDVNKFSDLARARQPVGLLAAASRGEGPPSVRQRSLYPRYGLGPELRVSFPLDGSLWGTACLSRLAGAPDFTHSEARFLAALAEPVALGLRSAVLLGDGGPARALPAGMLIVSRDGQLEAATAPAAELLGRLHGDAITRSGSTLPSPVHAVVMRALAPASDPRVARVRVQTASGQWLTLYASPLVGAAEERAMVVIEPSRPAEVAPIVAQAYDLSRREREVLALVAQGLALDEIARRLVISLYTARDHVKRIQAKVGVSSRAELVARLFVEHYTPLAT